MYAWEMKKPHRPSKKAGSWRPPDAQTQALLRENQALLDNAFVGIVIVRDRRVIRTNRRAETLFGYAPGELIGRSTAIIYPDRAAYLALGERAYPVIARGELFEAEVELARKDGSRFWCLMRAAALAPAHPLEGTIWVLDDATERRQTRQAVEDAAGLYRAIIESRNIVKLLVDPDDGHIVDANQAAAEFYGLPREVLRQRDVWDLSTTPRASLLTHFADIKAGRADLGLERQSYHRRANGDLCQVGVYLELVRREHRDLLLATVLDLTERKSTEVALQASEERLQLVLEGANDGFWDWNVKTGAILFSRHWGDLLGYHPAEVEPHIRVWKRLMHPDDQGYSRTALRAHFAGDTPRYEVEHRIRTKHGDWRWFLHRGKVTARDARGRPLRMVGTHTDITERRRVEEALRLSLIAAERHDAQMVALNRMTELLLACETRAAAYAVIAHAAGQLFDGFSGALAVHNADAASDLQVVARWGDASALPTPFASFDCQALRRGEVLEVRVQTAGCRHLTAAPPPSYLCIPWTVRGETLGLLHVSAREALTAAAFGDLRNLAVAVSESVKLTLSNIRLQETLREQVIRDPLTGLFNRRYLDEALPRELHRCRRRGEPLAVAMLDLDHFKHFNDTYGHDAGDAVLRAVGALLNETLRRGDIACRYGGEELTLILPGANLDTARARLEILRKAIMQKRARYQAGELPPITTSIGVTVVGAQETDSVALLARADAALYQAKKAGRNRVIAVTAQ